jgi:hypothetical protein
MNPGSGRAALDPSTARRTQEGRQAKQVSDDEIENDDHGVSPAEEPTMASWCF